MPGRKRRKVKQPKHLLMRDDDTLHMQFRTNFRLDRDEGVLNGTLVSIVMAVLTLVFVTSLAVAAAPSPRLAILAALAVIATLAAYYLMAVRLYNKTHIDMDESEIRISRKPLPAFFRPETVVSLAGVEAIRCAETEASKQAGYDTPRYRVWAEREDGSRRTIVNDVTEDYALFIAQRLDERLQEEFDESGDEEAEDFSHLILDGDAGDGHSDGELDVPADRESSETNRHA